MKIGFAIMVAVLLVAMWFVYNAISRWLGADTVANLAVNFLLFVAVGAAVGVAWKRLNPQGTEKDATTGQSL